jgi:hypothetical protein
MEKFIVFTLQAINQKWLDMSVTYLPGVTYETKKIK